MGKQSINDGDQTDFDTGRVAADPQHYSLTVIRVIWTALYFFMRWCPN